MTPSLIIISLLLLLLLAVTFALLHAQKLLASIILFSLSSLIMALLYLALKAPDVAITEAAIGAGISSVLFLTALVFIRKEALPSPTPRTRRWMSLLMVKLVGAALFYATLALPAMGDPEGPAHTHVSRYYLQHTQEDIGIPNTVTAILASYRGYDTLGEVCVVFTAMLAVLLLLKRSNTHA